MDWQGDHTLRHAHSAGREGPDAENHAQGQRICRSRLYHSIRPGVQTAVRRCTKTQARRESPAGLSPVNKIAPASWSAAVLLPLLIGGANEHPAPISTPRAISVE